MLRFSLSCVSAAALCTLSQLASGQTLGWLPMADLPPTRSEVAGDPIPPGVAAIGAWDPDGSGPLLSRVIVAGSPNSTFVGSARVVQLTDGGWEGLNSDGLNAYGAPYGMVMYRAPNQPESTPVVVFSFGEVMHFNNGTWTSIGNIPSPKAVCVGDPDGPDGPDPECLFIGGSQGVYKWNGVILQQLSGGVSVAASGALHVWDADGDGPQAPQLFAAPINSTNASLRMWTGSSWVAVQAMTSGAYEISSFDFDGDGPEVPDLVVGQRGSVKRWNSGQWSTVGSTSPGDNGIVYSLVQFDPDGEGPIHPWLVAGGSFTSIGGTVASRLAAYYDGVWHAFPPYVGATVGWMAVGENLPYSNSPQLLVTNTPYRPSIGRFGLCDGPAGITGNAPTRSRQPEGQSASFDVIPSGDELTFRWYKGETALVDGATTHGSTISGVYGPRLTIANVRTQDIGQYHAVVFNPLGEARSRDVALSLGCATDFNLDDAVDFSDYLDFIAAFATSDPDADFNADRTIDFFDYLDFVNQFASGC